MARVLLRRSGEAAAVVEGGAGIDWRSQASGLAVAGAVVAAAAVFLVLASVLRG
jgi:hypothetical protein